MRISLQRTLSSWVQVWPASGVKGGWGACKNAEEKEPGFQMDPTLLRHGAPAMGPVGAQLDSVP